jgi:hypothetical protein
MRTEQSDRLIGRGSNTGRAGRELGEVRSQLDHLVTMRLRSAFDGQQRQDYAALLMREHELLGAA